MYDLATEWYEWKKLPFVFAVWAVQKSMPAGQKEELREIIQQSLTSAEENYAAVGQSQAKRINLTSDESVEYLEGFNFRVGERERAAIEMFQGASPGNRKCRTRVEINERGIGYRQNMSELIIRQYKELIETGARFAPLGGFDYSGYNARLQNKYLEWRKTCLELLELSGPIAFPYKQKILGDTNGGLFYQSSVLLILSCLNELHEKLKAAPDLVSAPIPAASAESPTVTSNGNRRKAHPQTASEKNC